MVFGFLRKKKDEFDLGTDMGKDFGPEPDLGLDKPGFGQMPSQQYGFQEPLASIQPMHQPIAQVQQLPYAQQPNQEMIGKDIEILNSKLDAIKAVLESMNQRLKTLERFTTHEEIKNW